MILYAGAHSRDPAYYLRLYSLRHLNLETPFCRRRPFVASTGRRALGPREDPGDPGGPRGAFGAPGAPPTPPPHPPPPLFRSYSEWMAVPMRKPFRVDGCSDEEGCSEWIWGSECLLSPTVRGILGSEYLLSPTVQARLAQIRPDRLK